MNHLLRTAVFFRITYEMHRLKQIAKMIKIGFERFMFIQKLVDSIDCALCNCHWSLRVRGSCQ